MNNKHAKQKWPALIEEIEASGMTLTAIAAEVGLTSSGLCDLKKGRSQEPRFEAGMGLILLHKRTVGQ